MYIKFLLINEQNEILVNTEITQINNCYGFSSLSVAYQENISKYLMIGNMNCLNLKLTRIFSFDNFTNISPIIHHESNSYFPKGNDFSYFFCQESEPLLNIENNECVDICSSDEIIEKKCLINYVSKNNLEIINHNIQQIIQNKTIDKNVDIIIEGNNIIYIKYQLQIILKKINIKIFHQLILGIAK